MALWFNFCSSFVGVSGCSVNCLGRRHFWQSVFSYMTLQCINVIGVLSEYLGNHMSLDVRKHTVGHLRRAKIQISLRIRAAWSASSRGAFWINEDVNFWRNEDAIFFMRTLKTLICLRGCSGWFECLLGTHVRRYVSHVAAHNIRNFVNATIFGMTYQRYPYFNSNLPLLVLGDVLRS